MSADRELSRRAVIAGLGSALALAFAPLDRFMAGLQRFFEAIFGAPREAAPLIYNTKRNGYATVEETFSKGWAQTDWYLDHIMGSDSNDGRGADRAKRTWASLSASLPQVIVGKHTVFVGTISSARSPA